MSRFNEQVAIVTGAATGIGYGIARRLASEGARLVMVDIDGELGEQSASEISARGSDTRIVVGDVSEHTTAEAAVQAALDAWGRIDILVNNAGITGIDGNIWETSLDEMDRVYRVNLRGVFAFCHAAIPHMLDQDYGRIVNIASIAGKEGNPRMVPYSATKAAVIGLTKSVGKELAKTGIRVNCVTPGRRPHSHPGRTDAGTGAVYGGAHPNRAHRRDRRDSRARRMARLRGMFLQHGRRIRHQRRQSDILD